MKWATSPHPAGGHSQERGLTSHRSITGCKIRGNKGDRVITRCITRSGASPVTPSYRFPGASALPAAYAKRRMWDKAIDRLNAEISAMNKEIDRLTKPPRRRIAIAPARRPGSAGSQGQNIAIGTSTARAHNLSGLAGPVRPANRCSTAP